MDLTYELVRYAKLEVVEVTGSYPSNDNCYRVKVSYLGHNPKGAREFEDVYCPKPVVEMWKALSKAADLLPKENVVELLDAFNAHGEWMYYQGSIDESMANSEDL